MTTNINLMRAARASLKDKWELAIGTFLVYVLIMSSFGAMQKIGFAALLVAGPMMLGAAKFSLAISQGKEARLEQLFEGFVNFTNALLVYLLTLLYVLLWMLLLIIPGIMAALSYAMVFFILAEQKI